MYCPWLRDLVSLFTCFYSAAFPVFARLAAAHQEVADARAAGTAPEFGDHIGDARTGSLYDADGEAATADGSAPAKIPVRRPISTPTPPTRNTAAGDIAPKRGDGGNGEAGEARPSTWRPGR